MVTLSTNAIVTVFIAASYGGCHRKFCRNASRATWTQGGLVSSHVLMIFVESGVIDCALRLITLVFRCPLPRSFDIQYPKSYTEDVLRFFSPCNAL
ncbi:hypothetical protein Hypma_001877 [Hypsizygus marmoreus]|uniref:Uncharacterized protein n=1 Tax=Hypsizygus marmoreus TaxID=39966 RepID=A0A369JEE6_HYPMA|nr:hypothetical protein Hypma_001877 [Hypsizygus marmoreus]